MEDPTVPGKVQFFSMLPVGFINEDAGKLPRVMKSP